MNKIMTTISTGVSKIAFKVKKNSPEILMVTGVVGMVTATVMACKATTKASQINEEIANRRAEVEELHDDPVASSRSGYTDKDYQKDILIVRKDQVIEYAKLYGPSVAVGAASIAMIFASNGIYRKRNAALGAALTTVTAAFKKYRKGVIDRYGEAVDKEIRQGLSKMTVTNSETGEKSEVVASNGIGASEYGRFFMPGIAKEAENNYDYNMMYLRSQENFFNQRLRTYKHVYLNEIYDALGIERQPYGQVVGWVYNEKNPVGDNYIDFGVSEVDKVIDGEVKKVLFCDFNVDGEILSLMEVAKRG